MPFISCNNNYTKTDLCGLDSATWIIFGYNKEIYKNPNQGITFYTDNHYYEFYYNDSNNKIPSNGIFDLQYPRTIDYCKEKWLIKNNLLYIKSRVGLIETIQEDTLILKVSYLDSKIHTLKMVRID